MTTTTIERIIGKIDNDFNPDNSDWIPRVSAWVIDALMQIKVLRQNKVHLKLPVKGNIAYSDCELDANHIKVYDDKGCVIEEAEYSKCSECPSKGGKQETDISPTTTLATNPNYNPTPDNVISVETTHFDNIMVHETFAVINEINPNYNRNYVLTDKHHIELNFNTKYIVVRIKIIETYYSEHYDCRLPVIPNNGLLIEALTQYCMYKMLTRGYKHPVMNLTSPNAAINPYENWTLLKDKAYTSVINDLQGFINDKNYWRSAFYIASYDPLDI